MVVLPAVLPDLDGMEVLKQIKAWSASVGVLVYGVDSPEAALAAGRAGADGYFPQSHEPQELVMAIADVAAGQRYFPNVTRSIAPQCFASGSSRGRALFFSHPVPVSESDSGGREGLERGD